MRRTASTAFIYGIDRIIRRSKLGAAWALLGADLQCFQRLTSRIQKRMRKIVREAVAQSEKMREHLSILSILRFKG